MITLETRCESSTSQRLKPSQTSIKVAHVVLSLDCGGLERVVLNLVSEGRNLGQRVAVVCVEHPGVLASAVETAGAEVMCVYKRPGLRWGTIGRLKRVFRKHCPDVVHTHQIGALLYAGPAARGAMVPVIVHTEHGKHYAVRWRTRWLGRLAGVYAKQFFCVSRDIAAELAACRIVPDRKIQVVPNGIETNRFREPGDPWKVRKSLGIPAHAPVIGSVGRLCEVKRYDVLLRAFVFVKSRVPAAHLLLVGDGPLQGSLHGLADSLGLGDCVHFAGYQTNPEVYLQLMNVFALTSRSEGMPLALLEAWAVGLPVVASRVGGLPDLIDEGVTGLMFSPDDERCLASILCKLLTNETLARAMGAAGNRQVESQFSLGRMAGEYQRQYLKLLG